MKKTTILLLMSCLVGVYLWQKDRPTHAIQTMPHWPSIEQTLVTGMQVRSRTGEEITLYKKDVWMLGDQLADPEAVQRVLENIHAMQPIRVVTRNPEQYARLDVADDSARLILSDNMGKTILDLHIGKQGSDLISTYVRLHGTKDVIAVNKALVWQINRTQDNWQKKEQTPSIQDTYTDPYTLVHTE